MTVDDLRLMLEMFSGLDGNTKLVTWSSETGRLHDLTMSASVVWRDEKNKYTSACDVTGEKVFAVQIHY